MNTTIRISQSTLENLKVLKRVKGLPSYEDVIKTLAHYELCKTHVVTKGGYVPIGAVVTDGSSTLVINDIQGVKVLFSDGTQAINGSGGTWRLELLADTVENFDEEKTNDE